MKLITVFSVEILVDVKDANLIYQNLLLKELANVIMTKAGLILLMA